VNNQIPPNSYFSELRFRFPVYHFFYLSNALSILRILLVPAIYWSLISEHMVMLICVGGVAFISDMLDGYFARRLDQKSELGKVLDPIADKLTISLVSFALILSRKPEFDANFPVWAFLIMIMRDLLILTGSAFLFKRTQVIEPSNIWGRVATVFISSALILYILNYQQIFVVKYKISHYILWIGIALAIVSLLSHKRRLIEIYRNTGSLQLNSRREN